MDKKTCITSSFAHAFVNGHILDAKSFCLSCGKPWKEIKDRRCALEFHIKSHRNRANLEGGE